MQLYAVAGNPVYHSKSPLIFNRHFRERRIDARYLRFAARDADDIISFMRCVPLEGMNITAPFKQEIQKKITNIDDRAGSIGAVNTVAFRDGELFATCTDYEGVLRPLSRRISLNGSNAVLIGAGGAARAAMYALVHAGARVTVINRSFDKARLLAEEFGAQASPMSVAAIERVFASSRIVVHTLPHGANLPLEAPLNSEHVVLDANYHDSIYEKIARERNAVLIPGEEWLYEQADAAAVFMTGAAIDDSHMISQILSPPETINIKKHISLVGFMGSGKTSIGERLSEINGLPVYDIDQMIEEKASMPISMIFATFGEPHFRELESQILASVMDMPQGIIACGGGVLESESNRGLLKNSHCVWLYAPLDELFRRVSDCQWDRPLASNREEFEFRYRRRIPFYASSSDLVINAVHDIEYIARRIHDEISPFF